MHAPLQSVGRNMDVLYFAFVSIFAALSQRGYSKRSCYHDFVFPTLKEGYEIVSTENSTVTIPFHLKSTNCHPISYKNVIITLKENSGLPYCYITHTKDRCQATPAVPECKCLETGDYELQKVVHMSDNGQWEWLVRGTTTPLRQVVMFNISRPDPPRIRSFTASHRNDRAVVLHNSSVTIKCIINKGNPPAAVHILDEMGHRVTPCISSDTGNTHTGIETCTLHNVTCRNSGTYTCEAAGAVTVNKRVSLLVEGPPEISESVEQHSSEMIAQDFRVCSHTKEFTECFFSRRSVSKTDLQKRPQRDSQWITNIECASYRLNWTLEGTPPLLTGSVQTADMEGGLWALTLANAMGKTESYFFLHAPEETTDFNISFASTSYSKEFITDKASKDQPETSFLLTGAGFITLVSNGVVVLLIILLVIGIAVRRRGRRSRRALLEDFLLQQRRPLPQPPQMQQRHQIPRTHRERPTQPTAFQATVSVSNAVANERRSESSESDIYDNPNEEHYKDADGATGANVAALACTDSLPDDYLTPVTCSRVAVMRRDDLPDDYLTPGTFSRVAVMRDDLPDDYL